MLSSPESDSFLLPMATDLEVDLIVFPDFSYETSLITSRGGDFSPNESLKSRVPSPGLLSGRRKAGKRGESKTQERVLQAKRRRSKTTKTTLKVPTNSYVCR